MAQGHFGKGDYEEAIKCFDQVLEINKVLSLTVRMGDKYQHTKPKLLDEQLKSSIILLDDFEDSSTILIDFDQVDFEFILNRLIIKCFNTMKF